MITQHNIYSVLRAKDWRYSTLPFVTGCLYLFVFLFDLSFEKETLLFLCSFIVSAIGFACSGYLINEFFDIESDTQAGKDNKLSRLSGIKISALFIISFILLFIPWIWLPSDPVSWILIFSELTLLLMYSIPYPRLKNIYWISGSIDSLYAYVIPLLLAFHTNSIYSGKTMDAVIFLFLLAIFFFGFRNILIHQLRDSIHDSKAGIMTLPQKLGAKKTNLFLTASMLLEVFFFCFFSVLLSIAHPVFILWTAVFAGIIVFNFLTKQATDKELHSTDISKYSFTDIAYQLWFPLFNIFLLIYQDWRWVFLLPLHIILLIPRFRLEVVYFLTEKVFVKIKIAWHFIVLHFISRPANYIIYYFFKLFNVDLRKKNMSAFSFLVTFLKK